MPQIKSKERVTKHGEVYTAAREVNAMLDMVKQEAARIDSRFLEPACGNGNFLAEVLRRKLNTVKAEYTDAHVRERLSVLAVTSIYGIDILSDNADECRERLFFIWQQAHSEICGTEAEKDCEDAVRFILDRNIICGNALTMVKADPDGRDTKEPIIFSQWDLSGDLLHRRDYRYDELVRGGEGQADIFMYMNGWEYDEETGAWTPPPIKTFAPVYYWRAQDTKAQEKGEKS